LLLDQFLQKCFIIATMWTFAVLFGYVIRNCAIAFASLQRI